MGSSAGQASPLPSAAAEAPSLAEQRSPVALALVLQDPRLPASPAPQQAEALVDHAGGQLPAAEPECAPAQQRQSPPELIDPVPRMGSLQQAAPLLLAGATDAGAQGAGSGEAGGAQAHAADEEPLAGPEWQPEAFLNDFGSEGDAKQAAAAPVAAPEQQDAHAEEQPEEEAAPELHAGAGDARGVPHAEAPEQPDGASSPDMMGVGRGRWGADPAELVTEAIARVTSLCADLDVSDRPRGSQSRHTPLTSPARAEEPTQSASVDHRTAEVVSPAADKPASRVQQQQQTGCAGAARDGESAETISIPRAPDRAAEEASVGAAAGRAAQQEEKVGAAEGEWDAGVAPDEDPGDFPDDRDGGPEDQVPEQEAAAASAQQAAAALPQPAAALPQAPPEPARPGRPAGMAGSSLKKSAAAAAAAAAQGPARAAAAAAQEHSSGSGQCSTLTSHVGVPNLAGRSAAAAAASALQAESAHAAAAEQAAAGPNRKAKKKAKHKRAAAADAGAGAEEGPQQEAERGKGADEEPAAAEEEAAADGQGSEEAPAPEQAAPKCGDAVCYGAVQHTSILLLRQHYCAWYVWDG